MLKHLERKEEKTGEREIGVDPAQGGSSVSSYLSPVSVKLLQLTRIFADFSVLVACVLMF